MPNCCVHKCKNRGGHIFPKDSVLKQEWVKAIRRKDWTPTKTSTVCQEHFLPTDYVKESREAGYILTRKILRANSVPSVFPWQTLKLETHHKMSEPSQDVSGLGKSSPEPEPPVLSSMEQDLVPTHTVLCEPPSSLQPIEQVVIKMEPVDEEDTVEQNIFEDEEVDNIAVTPDIQVGCFSRDDVHYRNGYSSGSEGDSLENIAYVGDRDIKEEQKESLSDSDTNGSNKDVMLEPEINIGNESESNYNTDDLNVIPYRCSICMDSFKTESALVIHNAVYKCSEKKTVLTNKCVVCGEIFSDSQSLTEHYKIHRGLKKFDCLLCSRTFVQLIALKTHNVVHSGERPFVCDFRGCGKAFSQYSSLSLHKRSHSNYRPFLCDICIPTKSFAHCGDFKRHMRIHTNEKPCACTYEGCDKTFAQPSSLAKHMRIHCGERKEVCKFCNKTFLHLDNLKSHLNAHLGVKPYKCNECGKTFARGENLRVHMRSHTGVKPYTCLKCNKTFTQKSSLNVHSNRAHQNEILGI